MVRNFPKKESANKAPNKGAVYANKIKPWYNAAAVFSAKPSPSAKYKANIAKLEQKYYMCKLGIQIQNLKMVFNFYCTRRRVKFEN